MNILIIIAIKWVVICIIIIGLLTGVVLGLLRNWTSDHFPPHILAESWRNIHSCVVCHEEVNPSETIFLQVKPQPISAILKARLDHRMWPLIPSREASSLAIDQCWVTSAQRYRFITALTACIAMDSSLPHCTRRPLTIK